MDPISVLFKRRYAFACFVFCWCSPCNFASNAVSFLSQFGCDCVGAMWSRSFVYRALIAVHFTLLSLSISIAWLFFIAVVFVLECLYAGSLTGTTRLGLLPSTLLYQFVLCCVALSGVCVEPTHLRCAVWCLLCELSCSPLAISVVLTL